MKLHLLDRSSLNDCSFTIRKNSFPNFIKIWHCHPELELVYILKSTGTRFIGDNIQKFQEGDLVLIGKNLPHMWLNDSVYFEEKSKLKAEAIAIHFKITFLGSDFFQAPEMLSIAKMLEQSKFGIHFTNIGKDISKDFKNILNLNNFQKTLQFLTILNKLSKLKEFQLLVSQSYLNIHYKQKNERLNKVYEYLFNNFNKPIRLSEIAEIAMMNPSAFSRYFKRINRKTLTKFISEIRIGYACKKLLENKDSITAICFECGYNSVSNFNKQFKAITNLTPSEYINTSSKIAN
ncbi:MAG: AraC family transcriptional regulator [Flavobacteriaceae bacterium]|nr:AraC family transcriptional regulator [Flavobacteriaceae bacterium]